MIAKLFAVIDSSGLDHLINPAAIAEIVIAPRSKSGELATVVMNCGTKILVKESEKTFMALLKLSDIPAIHGGKPI